MAGGDGIWFAKNIGIVVDSSNDQSPVTLSIQVKDQKTIPERFLPFLALGTTLTSIQDPPLNATIIWPYLGNSTLPITQTGIRQTHAAFEVDPNTGQPTGNVVDTPSPIYTEQNTGMIQLWFRYGQDLNGANPAANYEGLSVNEYFESMTTNIQREWITKIHLNDHPQTATANDVAREWFVDQGLETNLTFTISSKDETSDSLAHIIALLMTQLSRDDQPSLLNNIGQNQAVIEVSRRQWYECGVGNRVGVQVLHSRLVATPNGRVHRILVERSSTP